LNGEIVATQAAPQVATRLFTGVADWRDEFVRGGYAATHKFIPGLSNACLSMIRSYLKCLQKPMQFWKI
jgi:hypothetical protein